MPKKEEKPKKKRYKTCNTDGCRKPQARRGLCLDHFAKEYPGKKAAAAVAGEAAPS
jgi:hypothetical protein